MVQSSSTPGNGAADTERVSAALAGDRDAFAAIYDAYADRIHTMCVHLLRDRDEAADVTAEVFLVAYQRLGQLRDPARLRSWLYAICRHEIYRRTKRRSRTHLMDDMNELERLGPTASAPFEDDVALAPGAVALLLRSAAEGLDERDRTVLELQLQGVDGDELAAVMGTSTSTGYQLVHRMRDRLERSLGALLVARDGRADCADLDTLLRDWDGTFSVVWRKRVARHVDGCDVCDHRRKAIPATLFGAAGASPLVVTPTSVRQRVLAGLDAPTGVAAGGRGGRGGWRSDGFPPAAGGTARRTPLLGVAALVLLVVGVAITVMALGTDEQSITIAERREADGIPSTIAAPTGPGATSIPSDSTTSPAAGGVTDTSTAGVTTTVAGAAPPATTTVPGAPPTTRAPGSPPTTRPSVQVPPTTVPPTPAPTTTTTLPPQPPTVRLQGPASGIVYNRGANGGECASNTPFTATIVSGEPTAVTLRWTAAEGATGTVAMTRLRLLNRWTGTIHLPFGSEGPITVVADATGPGGTGTSNTVGPRVASCFAGE